MPALARPAADAAELTVGKRTRLFRGFLGREKTAGGAGKTGAAWARALAGVFGRGGLGDEFWDELEEALVVADVGVPTATALLNGTREAAGARGLREREEVRGLLRERMAAVLKEAASKGQAVPEETPTVMLMVGVNGCGKTTSIAKLAHAAKQEGRSVLLAAADTFRAGATEQLRVWGERVGVDVIAHAAGGDPGAVAFDAMEAAKARSVDLVLVDTAGRLHTKHNLMEELKKVRRIVERQAGGFAERVVLVIDGTTGQNGLAQAQAFAEAVACDGVFLTKLDGTARGGVVLAIAGDLGLPVWFAGTGEGLSDLAVFDPDAFVETLLPPSPGT